MSDTASAAMIVRHARRQPDSSEERIVFPVRTSSLKSFEEDDIRVDRDTDRNDDAGHTPRASSSKPLCDDKYVSSEKNIHSGEREPNHTTSPSKR
jgi:hypothetical protein